MTREHDWRCTGRSGSWLRWTCAHASCTEERILIEGKEPKPAKCEKPREPEPIEANR